MALALYRKYRPATFAEVVGQEHVTGPLRTALASGRINHAYLFSGPRGCGKTSSARIMARSLNCENGPTPDPCGECSSCIALAPEGPGNVDVVELDAASHGGVDDARELRDRAFYAPAESRYRVFIIDEAHMVTTQGFNALLKIVEEPPEHLIFIFATTEPDKVITTIRSRTHHYPFRLIPPTAMRELLERNVAAEGVSVDPSVFPLVIRAGGGSARDTQSILDQLLAGASDEGVTYARAASLLGVTDGALLDDIVDGLAADDAGAVFGTVEKLADAGHDPRRFATDLLDRFRDLVLLRAVPDAGARGLIPADDQTLATMAAQAERMGPAALTRYAEIVHNGLLEMRGATAPRLVLELLCARMLLPAASDDEASLLHRLERLERRMTAGGVPPESAPDQQGTREAKPQFERPSRRQATAPPAPAPAPPAAQEEPPPTRRPAPPEPSTSDSRPPESPSEPSTSDGGREAAGGLDASAVRGAWPQILAAVRKTSRSTEAMLSQASVSRVEGSHCVLAHTSEPLVRRLSERKNAGTIGAALTEVFGGQWTVTCEPAGAQKPPQRAQPKQASRQKQRPDQQERRPKVTTTEPDVPLPPEPDDEDMYVEEPASIPQPEPKADPAADAQKLLADQLGARPLDKR